MKKLLLLIAIALLGKAMIAQAHPGAAQAANAAVAPPQAVVTAFAARFPDVQVKKWSESQQTWYASFRWKGKKTSAYYTPDGGWKATEVLMHWSWNLPENVKQAWKHSDFAAWYLKEISKIETPDGMLYALHVNNSPLLDSDHAQIDHDEYVIFFNEKGELVRKDEK